MPEDFLVRPAQPTDRPQMVQFQQAMALESEGLILDQSKLESGIQHLFDCPQDGQYWVATHQASPDELVGMCLVTLEWSDWHNKYYWWIQSVYVHQNFRKQGVLRALLEKIEIEAYQKGIQELRLYVEQENERAIQAYHRLGFTQGHYQVMQKSPQNES